MTRPELYSWKKLGLSVNDEPVQTLLFVRQDHLGDIIFHPQLSEEMKAGAYIVWLKRKIKSEFRYSLQSQSYEIERQLGHQPLLQPDSQAQASLGSWEVKGSSLECQSLVGPLIFQILLSPALTQRRGNLCMRTPTKVAMAMAFTKPFSSITYISIIMSSVNVFFLNKTQKYSRKAHFWNVFTTHAFLV